MRWTAASLFTLAWLGGAPGRLDAQTVRPAGRIEVGAGGIWLGRATLGSADATLTTPSGAASPLFTTSTVLAEAPGLGVRVSVRVWRGVEVEAFTSRASPTLETTISHDLEAPAAVTATESVTQYAVGGGALWYLPYRLRSTRLLPFLAGGVAHLRELHEADTLAVTGHLVEAGGGVKYFFPGRRRSRLRAFGVRGDVRLVARTNGVGVNDRTRFFAALSASVVGRF